LDRPIQLPDGAVEHAMRLPGRAEQEGNVVDLEGRLDLRNHRRLLSCSGVVVLGLGSAAEWLLV